MKNTARNVLLALSIGILSTIAYADGKFYIIQENIPANIPYQRAFIIFHENTETMILQSKYEISKSQPIDSLGWVVPVPSVPDITSLDADIADIYCFHQASISTQPKIFAISDLFGIAAHILFVLSFLSILILLLFFPVLKKIGISKEKWHKLANISFRAFLICFFIAFFYGAFMPGLRSQGAGGDIEIVKAEKAGIYDVKVIKSDNTDAIIEWLNENNFDFDVNDSDAFTDYISRDWCFVVAKVQPEPGTKKDKISRNGMAAPLVLKFNTEKAIYPTALTAAIGTETQILIYTLSDNKLDCKNRLKFEAARKTHPQRFDPNWKIPKEYEEHRIKLLADVFEKLPQDMIICKFKDTLTSEQMKEDIVFENASDNKPYRKLKIIWTR